MKDEFKGNLFRDLVGFDAFNAQKALEEETYNSLLAKLLRIDTSKPNVSLEYAKLRGSLDALELLKTTRERLIQDARSRDKNS